MDEARSAKVATCWVVSDGRPGMENQCLGLAEALGLATEVKRIRARAPWRWLPPQLWYEPLKALAADGDPLRPPWPDLVIASGRLSVAPALAVRRAAGGGARVVQIQNPVVDPDRFDLVIAPEHDRLKGSNVIATRGALHRLTGERLRAAAADYAPRVSHLPHPRVAVLIGGSNKSYRMTEDSTRRLAAQLATLARDQGFGLLITPSRRTAPEHLAILDRALQGLPAEAWNGHGENPYFAYLGLADAIVVTCDSVNMVSEAAVTGRPVHVVQLPGGSVKFRRFHRAMREAGITRPFTGEIGDWSYRPINETTRVAAEVRGRLGLGGVDPGEPQDAIAFAAARP